MKQIERVRIIIQEESGHFCQEMLALPKEKIYAQCNQIRFYYCMGEYFQYNDKIPKRILQLVENGAFTICGAWIFYLKHETHGYETWEDVSKMIMAMYQKECHIEMKYGSKSVFKWFANKHVRTKRR